VAHRDGDAPPRSDEARRADHATIDRLADELLPALVAKLAASGLGELDVREGDWRVRLRMPGDGRARRGAGARGVIRGEGHGPGVHPAGAHAGGHGASAAAPGARVVTAGSPAAPALSQGDDGASRAVATAPAVGFFRPRPDLAVGARVRAGDRVGTVDVLGVPQEVVAPVDGVLGAALVEAGDPVEYGQELVEI
jgi:biotin carboxyl carrier protein